MRLYYPHQYRAERRVVLSCRKRETHNTSDQRSLQSAMVSEWSALVKEEFDDQPLPHDVVDQEPFSTDYDRAKTLRNRAPVRKEPVFAHCNTVTPPALNLFLCKVRLTSAELV